MLLEATKHNIKFSKVGNMIRELVAVLAVQLLRLSRKMLKWSLKRCSWCGANCGMNSVISKKGMRCCEHIRLP